MALYRGPGGIGSGSVTTTPVQVAEGGTGATSATDARTNLGLGTVATQNSNNVSITGGTVQNITDIAVADGGTGASTAANARVNLLPSYTGNGSKVLALNSSANDVEWVTNGNGTVSSVGLTVPTGLAVTNSPITTSGNIDIAFDTGYSIPTTVKQSNWDDAYTFVGNFPSQTSNSGKYLTTDGSVLSWGTVTDTYTGTVTSVAATVPTGFTISGSPITTTGTLALAFDTGYALPTTASQTNWDTAYGWGDHSTQGYLTQSSTLEGGTY